MDITIDELLKGKPTIIRGKNYFPTRGYVEPFLERLSKVTEDFRVHVQLPDQMTRTVEGNINMDDITYNRVYIEAVMPSEYCFTNHDAVIGMVMGLDCRKPVAKFYNGSMNSACTNLCVFNPEYLECQEIQPETPLNFKPLERLIEMKDETRETLQILKHTMFNNSITEQEHRLGQWVRNAISCEYDSGFGKVKLSVDSTIQAYKDLFVKEDSAYFQKSSECSMFDVYNAFTQQITNARDKGKDLINMFEKTILLKRILNF